MQFSKRYITHAFVKCDAMGILAQTETEAMELIQRIAGDVRHDAEHPLVKKSVRLLLESFPYDHILTELLQNADDVGATIAEIKLTEDGIFFSHDGEQFNEEHLRALCSIGRTTKKAGVHIGFMGIGFKASFKVSDMPHVFSGPFRFYFTREEVIVPHWLDEIPVEIQEHLSRDRTTFFLPLRQDLPAETIAFLKETFLTKVEALSLVFLKNIEKVAVSVDGQLRQLTKSREILSESPFIKERVSVTEKRDGEERRYDYLIFKKILEIPEQVKNDHRAKDSLRAELETTTVTIAFNLRDGLIEPVKSLLYTFLPTPIETGLKFTVNCDFMLNTQRTDIDFASKWNLWLLDSISVVLKDIVHELIHDEKQKLCFYDVLPRKREVPEILFAKIAAPLIQHMKENPLILTAEGGLAKPSEVVLASEDVQEIIPPEKAGVRYYVDSRIRGKSFLEEELGIKDLSEPIKERNYVLSALLDKGWLSALDATQIRSIYEFLHSKLYGGGNESWKLNWSQRQEIETQLKEMEIVRSIHGKYYKARETILPKKSGTEPYPLVDLPCLVFVDPAVISETSREFLKNLGANEFTEESIVNRILESHSNGEWKKWTEEERLRSVGYIAKWLEKNDYKTMTKLSYLVLPTETGAWASASICYIGSPELRVILPNACYVDLSKIRDLVKDVRKFLLALGVLDFPRVLRVGKLKRWDDTSSTISKVKQQEYWSWLYSVKDLPSGRGEEIENMCLLDGFDECVLSQDTEKLAKYLNFLLDHWNDYYKNFLVSIYRWFYYTQRSETVPSYFEYQLKGSRWLPTTKGLAIPSEVFAPLREIKKVGGNIVPYLKIPEEKARQRKEFLQFLGVRTEVDLKMLLSILSKARHSEVDDELKKQLTELYKKMADLCEDESIEEEVYILDRKGKFQPSRNLYWLDVPEIECVFGEELPLAWVPDNMPRHSIEALFNALKVVRVSSVLERKRIDDGQEGVEYIELGNELRRRGDYLYSVLAHYKARKVEEFPSVIRRLIVVKVDPLVLQLKVLDKVHQQQVPCLCSIDEGKIYVSPNVKYGDIAREFARAFEAPSECGIALDAVLKEKDTSTIPEFLRGFSIQLIQIMESAEIEASYIPEPQMSEYTPAAEKKLPSEFQRSTILKTLSKPLAQEAETVPTPQFPIDIDRKQLRKGDEDSRQMLTERKGSGALVKDILEEARVVGKVISETGSDVRSFDSAATMKDRELIEEIGMRVAMKFEQSQGRNPENVSDQNLGFDIRSKAPDGSFRYIEVKARAMEGEITLTENEWRKARELGNDFWIYIVVNAKAPELYTLQNPAEKLKPKEKVEVVCYEVVRHVIENWKDLAIKEKWVDDER